MEKQSLAKFYTDAFHSNWDDLAFTNYEGANYKYRDVAKTIKSLHLFYQINGIQRGDKIALIGRNSANWGAVFLSAISAGIVIVPILPDFNKKDTIHIINHSEAKIIISSKPFLDKIELAELPHLQSVLALEDFSLHAGKDENVKYKLDDAFQYYEKNTLQKNSFAFEPWDDEEVCIISYTSGTSGFTKGVMIPARSLLSNIVYARGHMPLERGNKIVSFLPMAHVYGLLFEFLFPLTVGCHITFLNKIPSPAVITQVFGMVKPHLILSVPLVIEKIYKKKLLPTLQKPAMKILLKIPVISDIILKKIRGKLVDTFGGRFFEIVIGGAPLSAEVEQFFKRINFPFTIGYGMTECGPLISYETWNKTRPASSGKLVDRMEIRIDSTNPFSEVGEIQVKGANTMVGYYKNDAATGAAFTDDGWLKTGDLGLIDENNFVYISGRSKNMLLGPSGQNIYPEEIEARLSNLNLIAECVVTMREDKLVAFVYPDFDAMKLGKIQEKDLPEIMETKRKKINSELPKYEQISKIELVAEEFEKTPKKNIKRFRYV